MHGGQRYEPQQCQKPETEIQICTFLMPAPDDALK